MKQVIGAIIAVMMTSSVSYGEFLEAGVLYSRLNGSKNDSNYAISLGFIMGIADTYDPFALYIPPGTVMEDLVNIVNGCLAKDKTLHDIPAAVIVQLCLGKNFPKVKKEQ